MPPSNPPPHHPLQRPVRNRCQLPANWRRVTTNCRRLPAILPQKSSEAVHSRRLNPHVQGDSYTGTNLPENKIGLFHSMEDALQWGLVNSREKKFPPGLWSLDWLPIECGWQATDGKVT